jgi:hypothetical protein
MTDLREASKMWPELRPAGWYWWHRAELSNGEVLGGQMNGPFDTEVAAIENAEAVRRQII